MKIGIALGGGGAKGLAHIGVLEVLEENGIRPDFVAGTSIGSIIGAIYCLHGSASTMRERARKMIHSKEFQDLELDKFYTESENTFDRFKKEVFEKFYLGTLLFKKSHSRIEATRKLYKDLFGQAVFKDCRIRFACNALNIQSGGEVIFTSGPLADAVWASCAIPGIFPPFTSEQQVLVDGGVINNVPVDVVEQLGAGIVLAVYLGNRPHFEGMPDTGFRINVRAQSFVRYFFDQKILESADCIVRPETRDFHWADFQSLDELVEIGRKAAQKNLPRIKTVTSRWFKLRKFLSKKI
jgi:NTE family protein